MGRMVDGVWTTAWYTPDEKGRFVREQTRFHARIGTARHPAEAGRYHLYASWACPWAHRVLIARALHGLEDAISLSTVHWFMGDDGWTFEDGPGVLPDTVNHARFLRDVYKRAKDDYTGRVTVPVLWDRVTGSIVNNESREIVRMLGDAMRPFARHPVDLCPEGLRDQVDAAIDAIYAPINNGVYRSGFATSQQAYEEAATELFAALDDWEEVLGRQRWMCGDTMTEADIFLFTTLCRFDVVYYTHFKCNRRHVYEYPNLWRLCREIYALPGVAETCNFEHIKRHYFESHPTINPTRIVPIGPINPFTG